ncbi:MAG: hypothetical protein WCF65_03520 [Parachlamydiaceae bacterium]
MTISSTPIFSGNSAPTASGCCGGESPVSPWLKRVDKICRVAIAVFAAIIAPTYFAVSFAIGSVAGAVYATTRHLQHKPMLPEGTSKPVCAQGYMDFLAGMRFPPAIGTIATTAFIAAHTRHDPKFYVPFCGLFLGFLCGREIVSIGLLGPVKDSLQC